MLGGLAAGFAQIAKPSAAAQGKPRDARARRAERRRARRRV
jgi:hypothetical protein